MRPILMAQRHLNTLLFLHVRHAVKTGLACVLAFAVSNLLGLHFALWAVVSTIIAMQGLSVADSLQNSLLRFTGMAIGAIIGMGLLLIAPDNQLLLGLELFLLTALGAYLTRYGMRYMLASTAACILLLGGKMAASSALGLHDPLIYGLTLVGEVAIGVAAALVVSFLVWPVRLGDTLKADLSSQFRNCADLLDRVIKAYLDKQQHLSYKLLNALSLQIWANHERMNKVIRLEAYIYRGHKDLEIRVTAVDRTVEALRGLLDALNEYDEEGYSPILGPELSNLAGHIISALRHLSGDNGHEMAPPVVRALTEAVDQAERRLTHLRTKDDRIVKLPLHRVLQLYTFYQTLRQLTEELLLCIYDLQKLKDPANRKVETLLRRKHGKGKKV